jgi:hypothetical protein
MSGSESVLSEMHTTKCELAVEALRSAGKLRLGVAGLSMLPTVWPGDTLVIERVASDVVLEGDVVLFERDRRLFVHRIVSKDPGGLILTRGDAMAQLDPPVSDRDLLGKVLSIQRSGKRIVPVRNLSLGGRAVAALVQRSAIAARIVVGLYRLRWDWQAQNP